MVRQRLRESFIEETSWDADFLGNWTLTRGKIYHKGALMRTEELGASVRVTFWGTGVKLLGLLGWNHSQLAISLDGGNVTIFDAYCCPPTGSIAQVVQFSASGLGRGAHVLNVTNLVAGPHGNVLDIDAFIVTQPPVNVVALSILGILLLTLVGWMIWVRRGEASSPTDAEAQNAYQMVPTHIPLDEIPLSNDTDVQAEVAELDSDSPPLVEESTKSQMDAESTPGPPLIVIDDHGPR
ncbi:hypothetical protein C8F01DRAFT_1158561 [Mycena amicta]|nr:hypothetical protein C8F01DRAFT_1158561 [Mycena amicta]